MSAERSSSYLTPMQERVMNVFPMVVRDAEGWTFPDVSLSIANVLGITRRSAAQHLTRLADRGLLDTQGSHKAKQYREAGDNRGILAVVASTPADLCSLVDNAQPGQKILYHRGCLACDRRHDRDVNLIANMAIALFEAGRVHLIARRNGDFPDRFDYFGIVRP